MRSGRHFPYRSSHVANFILEKAEKDEIQDVSVLKLLKLVYISFGWTGAFFKRKKLFTDSIEAWKYGPVVPVLYYEFKRFGKDRITEKAPLCSPFDKGSERLIPEKITEPKLLTALDVVWNAYKNKSASELMRLTHAEGTPWWTIYYSFPGPGGIIPHRLIHDHYIRFYKHMQSRRAR